MKRNDKLTAAYLKNIIAVMPGHIYWEDKEGILLGCNDLMAKTLGVKKSELIGKSSKNYIPAEKYKAIRKTNQRVMRTGKSHTIEENTVLPNGKEAVFLTKKSPLRDDNNNIVGIIGVSFDVTDRKVAQKQLVHAKELAEVANQAKSEFLANMSHDIRTPIANIVSLGEHILHKTSDPKIKDLAYDIQVSAEQTMKLLNEILEISELELGHIPDKVEIFSLSELLQNVVSLFKAQVESKGLKLSLKYDESLSNPVSGKQILLHRVLLNIVANAVKFTQEGEINIIAKRLKAKDKVVIKISDTGIGFPKSKYRTIFDQFERLTAAYEGNFPGRGLGLYVVKKFVNAMNGKIAVKSEENKGSTFTLTIPLQPVIPMETRVFSNEAPAISKDKIIELKQSNKLVENNIEKKPVILLVEDTKLAQKVTIMTLEPLTERIDLAASGKEAILKAKTHCYDLILMDIGLPDISGIEATKQIRKQEAIDHKRSVPIIALTAHLRKSEEQQALSKGIQQIIHKPLRPSEAKILLENWFSNKDQELARSSEEPVLTDNPIDLRQGAEFFGGNMNVAKKMLSELIKILPGEIKKIQGAYNAKNWQILRDVIHGLHGGVCYVGVPFLKKACHDLEVALVDKRPQHEINMLYDQVVNSINDVITEYKKITNK